MPIRMVDDPNDNYSNENENTGGNGGNSGGGGNGLFQFLPMIIGLLIRKPILLLVVAVIGALMYFKTGCNSAAGNLAQLATGGVLDPQQYKKAEVYEALDESKNDLPEQVSLLKFAPDRKNQGQQGSCVAWSSAYGARTILQAASTGESPNSTAFSPAFMYNQIGLEGCQGSYIIRAMENMTQVGAVPFNEFPYDESDCSKQPNGTLLNEAQQYKMLGFTRLSGDESTSKIDVHAIKEHLAKDVPVVIGMMVGGSFMQSMMGQDVWHPTYEDYNMLGFGGHAMCVIGYDDRKEGGSFQIMNSWGSEWGNNGVGWVLYKDFKHFAKEAYGLNPLPKKGAAVAQNLSCEIGLVNEQKQYINLQKTNGNIFETVTPIAKMSKFKIEVKNNNPCYIYVLGQETDGSSYVLFPYPTKANPQKTMFSPYCGITGYRLFPRGKSLQADEVGNKDYMAIITSTEALDIFAINNAVNQNKVVGFINGVNKAINADSYNSDDNVVSYSANSGRLGFSSPYNKRTVAVIVAIDKQ
ncbi:MAG: C1 family peptidase [Chitinophagaceae bacterium]